MFKKFWLDVIFATLFIFAFMGVLNSVTAFKIFDVFDPIGDALGDMEVTDVVFSRLRDDPAADERIVLVNIGTAGRAEIGAMLQIIAQYNPLAVGMDSFFYYPKSDSLGDQMLTMGLASTPNLVMASKLLLHESDLSKDSIAYSWEDFNVFAADNAFVNLITDAETQEDLKMCRSFMPQCDFKGQQEMAFAVKLASYYDSAKVARFLSRNNEREVINYKGNVLDYGATKFGTKYFALDVQDVFQENFVPSVIEDKIVIFCYLGKYLGDRESLEDKFYTPLNSKYIGRAFPDMYGGVVHANIVSMILDEAYIDSMSTIQAIILAILLCFINVALFSLIYHRLPQWYDGTTKLIQLVELAGLTFLMIYILDVGSYKIDFGLALFAIAIAGDALEVYFGVVKNVFTKAGRRLLFKSQNL